MGTAESNSAGGHESRVDVIDLYMTATAISLMYFHAPFGKLIGRDGRNVHVTCSEYSSARRKSSGSSP